MGCSITANNRVNVITNTDKLGYKLEIKIIKKMKNTFDRTVYFLCLEIDELKEEVKYWREKYEEEKTANAKMLDDNLKQAQQGVANALLFALSVHDDENGNLVISKENRQSLAETWS